jgi:hypothetical protein
MPASLLAVPPPVLHERDTDDPQYRAAVVATTTMDNRYRGSCAVPRPVADPTRRA